MQSVRKALQHPMTRGMISYSILWPTGTLVQQALSEKSLANIDWVKCARFSAYGALFVAPTLFAWVRFAGHLFPNVTFGTALAKVAVEQATYGPFSMCAFFYSMAYMETLDSAQASREVVEKFLPTWKVAVCYWPFVSTINFAFVPERNRLIVASVASLLYTTFLSYQKQLDLDKLREAAPAKLMASP